MNILGCSKSNCIIYNKILTKQPHQNQDEVSGNCLNQFSIPVRVNCLLYEFQKKKMSATEAIKNICDVYLDAVKVCVTCGLRDLKMLIITCPTSLALEDFDRNLY